MLDQDMFQFEFAVDADGVLSVAKMFEVENDGLEVKRINRSTFEIEQDELGNVTGVIQSKASRGEIDYTSYSDDDGDGVFTLDWELEVATSARKAEKHKFEFDESGNVVKEMELKGKKWKTDRIDEDESYQKIDIDGVSYVVKMETNKTHLEFEIMRDDNGDGVYAKVMEGEGNLDKFIDENGGFDLATVQDYLAVTDSIIG